MTPTRKEREPSKMPDDYLASWMDLTAGLALLCFHAGPVFDWEDRCVAAIDTKDVDAMEHLTALMIVHLGDGTPQFARDRWGELSRRQHVTVNGECLGCGATARGA